MDIFYCILFLVALSHICMVVTRLDDKQIRLLEEKLKRCITGLFG
ncbi:MAG: hypothetical protein ACMUIA_04450 [bacterium]